MNNLSPEYLLLFNGITAAIEKLNSLSFELASLQTKAEELFISRSDD